jgi:hypothetical protein
MTDPTLDRTFTAWLEERAQPHAPTGLAADIVERTARTRPRPAWRIPERWFSMPTTIRLALIPRDLLLILALWLILALTVAGAAIGGRITFTRAVLPAPVSGPAANGLIAFERDSDIWVVEPDGSGERPLIASPGIQLAPSWSRDGTRIAYWSAETDAGPWDLVVGGWGWDRRCDGGERCRGPREHVRTRLGTRRGHHRVLGAHHPVGR